MRTSHRGTELRQLPPDRPRIRALTIWQPWAHAVVHLGKGPENRGYPPPRGMIGMTFAIHAGKAKPDLVAARPVFEAAGVDVPPVDAMVFGAVIGVARLVGVCEHVLTAGHTQCGPWAAIGQCHWQLADVVALDPVYCDGKQRFWDLPADVADEVTRQLQLIAACAATTAPTAVRRCRVCGCTDDRACDGGCSWVTDPQGGNLCSACKATSP